MKDTVGDRGAARGWLYRDRTHAGECLAARLDAYRDTGALVLGIPRGGVPVAAEVARLLEAGLDVVVARKLRAPDFPELAIGAVTANGGQFLNEDIIRELGVSHSYLQAEIAVQMADAARREERFRGGRTQRDLTDRVVIIVDDGLATGATMRAAVRSVRSRQPARLVVAVPVGSARACEALRLEADELICLHEPEEFWAVGAYYLRFEPVHDDEVARILHAARERAPVDTVGLDERRLRA
jgi:putative phosphoribosyl transferase